MSRNWEGGSTTAWRKVRALVLARDGYLCQEQVDGVCTTRATQVHHVLGRSVTGDDPTYLRASCQPCNVTLGDPTKVDDPDHVPSNRW